MRTSSMGCALCIAVSLFGVPAFAAEHLVVVERPKGEITLPLGGKEDAVGNMLVFANKVYDSTNKIPAGTDQGFCVRTVVGKAWECVLTYTTAEGQITTEGPYLDSGDSTWSVTGGTGKYAGARGSMKIHALDAKGSALQFTYDLL